MSESATELLAAVENGDDDAQGRLFSLLYDELRRCAHRQLHGAGETLSTTALVHETYVKLVANDTLRLQSRQHFMALAARAMRQVLVDHARRAMPAPGTAALNRRQQALLTEARNAVDMTTPNPLIRAEGLRAARVSFDRITGRASTEDMLDALFGRFCIGK